MGTQLKSIDIEYLPYPIVICDYASRMVMAANNSANIVFSHHAESLVGLSIFKFFQPQSPSLCNQLEETIFKATTDGPQIFQWAFLHDSEKSSWYEINLSYTTDQPKGLILLVARDISPQKDWLLEKVFTQKLIDGLPGLFFIYDQQGRLIKWNSNLAKMADCEPDELGQKHYLDWFAKEDRPAVEEAFGRLLTKGEASLQARLAQIDGTRTPYFFYGNRFVNNQTSYVLGLGFDISERVEAQRALDESRGRLLEAQSFAKMGNWELDNTTGSLHWSDEIYRIFGVEKDCFTPTYDAFLSLVHPDDRLLVDQSYNKALREHKTYDTRHRIVTPQGQEKYVREKSVEIHDDNGVPLRSIGIVQDITESHLVEMENFNLERQLRQAQKMEALGAMAGGIAHDFNNILGVMMGYTELALYSANEGKSEIDTLEMVLQAGDRAKDLIKQILSFSRQNEQELKPVSLAQIIKDITAMVRASLPSTIDLKIDLGENNVQVVADPTGIQQVIMNLCTNAAHAMKQKGGVLALSLDTIELSDDDVMQFLGLNAGKYQSLTVSDTGHGMSQAVMERAFEPFFTTKQVGEGTGLGLSVVHGIIKSFGGDIKVYSVVGKGTTLHILLPLTRQNAKGHNTESHRLPLPQGREHVLFVDDEKPLVDLGVLLLEKLGYKVSGYNSSLGALEYFKSNCRDVDLVITDLTMPNMTGDELAATIQKLRPGIPIIICSGFSEEVVTGTKNIWQKTQFIRKPLVLRDIATAIRKALD